MLLKWTKEDPIEVVGFGTVPGGGELTVPDYIGEVILGGDGWEKAKAPTKSSPAMSIIARSVCSTAPARFLAGAASCGGPRDRPRPGAAVRGSHRRCRLGATGTDDI